MKHRILENRKVLYRDIKPYNLPVTEPVLHTIRTARGSFFYYDRENRQIFNNSGNDTIMCSFDIRIRINDTGMLENITCKILKYILVFQEYNKSIIAMKDYNKALFYIAGNRRGWIFSPSDIMNKFSRREADDQIKYLLKKGKIRRIDRGLYEYPRYSDFLKQELSPDMDMAVKAIARKFNWRTEVSGETALNILGLSTQVPGRYIYLSDGPSRVYNILGTPLEFRKTVLKDIGFKYKESSWIVQSLKALGKDYVNERVIKTIKNRIDPKMCDKILRDTKSTKNWIYEYIKEICREDE